MHLSASPRRAERLTVNSHSCTAFHGVLLPRDVCTQACSDPDVCAEVGSDPDVCAEVGSDPDVCAEVALTWMRAQMSALTRMCAQSSALTWMCAQSSALTRMVRLAGLQVKHCLYSLLMLERFLSVEYK